MINNRIEYKPKVFYNLRNTFIRKNHVTKKQKLLLIKLYFSIRRTITSNIHTSGN